MPDEFWLYSQTTEAVEESDMEFLALDAQMQRVEAADGIGYTFAWPDLKVICNIPSPPGAMDAVTRLEQATIQLSANRPNDRTRQLLRQIAGTKLVMRVAIEPAFEERSAGLMDKLNDLLHPIVFGGRALIDAQGKVLLGADGSFEEDAGLAGNAELIPLDESDNATLNQVARADRSRAKLMVRGVPLYTRAMYVQDDAAVSMREAADVARRILVLYTLARAAEGAPREGIVYLLQMSKLWDAVSPLEQSYLEDEEIDHSESHRMMWRYEAVWTLLWALGEVGDLPWPSRGCNMPKLESVLDPLATDPTFIDRARMIAPALILDARDLTLRLHWAIRNEYRNQRTVPFNLDWSDEFDHLPVYNCPAVQIVEQRHHALNWLTRAGGDDWDSVDVQT